MPKLEEKILVELFQLELSLGYLYFVDKIFRYSFESSQ
jgi:hypothetical protein